MTGLFRIEGYEQKTPMLKPLIVGWMRRAGIWSLGQRAHRVIAPPICAGIHQVVETLGHRYLPIDLVLKHHYDYVAVHVNPRLITGSLKANAGLRTVNGLRVVGLERYRRWRDLGGGWKSANRHISRSFTGRFIADGDWDSEVKPFEILPSMVQLFVESAKPEETIEYQNLLSKVQNKDFKWTRGFTSVQEIDEYLAQTSRLFEDIRANGYRTQAELGNDGADEIRVCIDREGRLSVFGGGTHRLSIALLLEIRTVPVLIKRVHAHWVADCVRRFGGTTHVAIAQGVREVETASG